jgi:bacterioferritin
VRPALERKASRPQGRHCSLRNSGDFGSRELLEDILEVQEEHIDWLETQLGLIDKISIENYLQSQMGE